MKNTTAAFLASRRILSHSASRMTTLPIGRFVEYVMLRRPRGA